MKGSDAGAEMAKFADAAQDAAQQIKTLPPGHKLRKRISHRQAKTVGEEHRKEAGLIPDVRTQYAILKEKRQRAAAEGRVFENRLSENGEWV